VHFIARVWRKKAALDGHFRQPRPATDGKEEDCVAASGAPDELTSLEAARARLEAQLADDEHWRALQQPLPAGEEAQASAARQARNIRLKMALAENPHYQAWRHLGEAIAALRASGAENAQQAEAGSRRARPASPQAPPVADAEPPAGPRVGRAVAEPEEAEVSFVRREPLLPSAHLPSDLGTDRASPLFERLRGLREEEQAPAEPETPFASPIDDGGEAEVSIVSGESARRQRQAEEKAGTVRRLRKALSGD
jgi:hypothetical protein